MFLASLPVALFFLTLASDPLTVEAPAFKAEFRLGSLYTLTDQAGHALVVPQPNDPRHPIGLHRIAGDHWAESSRILEQTATGTPWRAKEEHSGLSGLAGGRIIADYAIDAENGELLLTHNAQSPETGVCGLEWTISGIPLDMNIIVPGFSGMKFTRKTPGASQTFEYPMSWEAQLVIVEGPGYGFYVRAEDAKGVYKRLTLERTASGWRLGFITMPYAPFEDKTTCPPVTWRINTFTGDWRVPAKRYLDWAEKALQPVRVEKQRPEWAKDIRCCIIMDQDLPSLEQLATRLDPKQTMIYLYNWRKAGYDRNYPSYDQLLDNVEPFIARAHALGFRIMLHVNYFGCDPLNPLYAQFEPFQVRSPLGSHEKEYWLWTEADPIIKFAYINPAYKPWRDLLVDRLSTLCRTYQIDALHLDQTLCIYNDYNGLIDGMSMIEGNVALHRDLRKAMPDVALSGEGLNEVTYRYETFCQRHVMGIDHAHGTFNKALLQAAHPISSYLFRPFTTIYGYLGYAPPTDGQLYSAWNEAYQHYGVIPTLKPGPLQGLQHPTGFMRQFFDEVTFWQANRVDIDTDGEWPPTVAFPYKTANGDPVIRTVDRRFLAGGKEISRTLSGVRDIALPGSVPGWRAYADGKILGLDPVVWYPYISEPFPAEALHVTSPLPEGFTMGSVVEGKRMTSIQFAPSNQNAIWIADLLGDAQCGSRPYEGPVIEARGELSAEDGAIFNGSGEVLSAHPPYKNNRIGEAYARIAMKLPSDTTRFICDVALDPGAVGQKESDGVTFRVTLQCDGQTIKSEVHNATSERKSLSLDLMPFAGKEASLELAVSPGPQHNPGFDWARWFKARIERRTTTRGNVTLVTGAGEWRWALSGTETRTIEGGTVTMETAFPGGLYLLRNQPDSIILPFILASATWETSYADAQGRTIDAAQFASAEHITGTVGGIVRDGIYAHPPDHGQTCIALPVALPDKPATFHAYAGIRDGSTSTGVVFIVAANGVELVREKVLPGTWHELSANLTPWQGKPAVITLTTDSDGNYSCDWAYWGEPLIK